MTTDIIARLDALPLVAILRGLEPAGAVEVGEALVEAGLTCLEVPLNSPRPLDSIERLRSALGDRAIVGAGTVLTAEAVKEVAAAGGQIIISPNTDVAVIRAARAAGLASMPGFFTPSEAFAAIGAGAQVLKLFPAEVAGTAGLKAVRAVLPAEQRVYAVGGVEPDSVAAWRSAGASGFGIGSAIYRAGRSATETGERAAAFVAAWTGSSPRP
ncbi:2-dehydro-3-deoxy-6-phosphogalactonate aldolase [Brevundimonas sp.]|uniref:2-dehydro-3-deoxy-6-phosphogalactonate aldolase n=1 Tax=Brevundimonas sp. TaxID=1871086 RepID=UPI0027378B54|nr:2-dehydro-3-deoxy-6-phosphogalactonate aldolase [Brevundimonas sp.]MDP3801893.1 2-dehydro-3-deoxy-6-phosphogalactonate aldolase [Brevundimonas sp.]